MVGVGIAQIVDTVRGCTAASDMPACDTFPYFYTGAIVGAVVMVILVQWKIGRRSDGPKQSERS